MSLNSFITLAFSKSVMMRSFKVALLVGTLLALINHGENILSMNLSFQDCLKILLTYLVPYSVSTWSAVQALKGK